MRAATLSSDFALPYAAARAWRSGDNPYDHGALDRIWLAAGGEPERRPNRKTTPSIYPPTTLILVAPLTFFSWKSARYILLLLNLALTLLVLKLLLPMANFAPGGWRASLFLALAFGLAPLQTGMALGNLIIPAAALALLAVWAGSTKKEALSGILLALSLCLKPQIGAIFWLGYVLQRRRRAAMIAIVISLVLAIFALGRLELSRIDWLNQWKSNYLESFSAGGTNSPTAANPSRHHLLNLQWLLNTFLESGRQADLLTYAFVGIQLAVLCLSQCASKRNEILLFSALIVLGLLSSYHRFYDATLLILPLLWSLTAISGGRRKQALLSLSLIIPFMIPGAVILKESLASGYVPRSWGMSWWWNSMALPHQVWLLAGLSLCLTYALVKAEGSYDQSAS